MDDGRLVIHPADTPLTKVAASCDSKLLIARDHQGNLTLWDGKQITMLKSPTLISKVQ